MLGFALARIALIASGRALSRAGGEGTDRTVMNERRLIIVSNRLPVTVRSEHGHLRITPSSGGLATALGRVHYLRQGEWHGWPGDLSRATTADRRVIGSQLAAIGCVAVHLTAAEVAHFYDGFSNGVLWPLLHYQIDKVRLDAEHDWTVYREVNQRFAERIAERLEPSDLVWVHDYQLMLVPSMIRELCPRARIGFFLHVPFPASEVFGILPWRNELVNGLLGADLVSFHTPGYRRNFCDAVARTTGSKIVAGSILHGGRSTRTASHPIGIAFSEFDSGARAPDILEEAAHLRDGARGRKIILGVDRLDYTKGILRRLLAVERLLERSPALREKILFVQLAVPSREKVDSYAELRKQVNELVGRINSQYGSPTSAPIQLLYRSISREHLLALYRAADVMLVTPLRDGMNLVAKEYVAARSDEQGVLVLSEFAGAATELHEAICVNPYDLGMVAHSIKVALSMPPEEQRARMVSLRERVRTGCVERWVDDFLRDLEKNDAAAEEGTTLAVGHA
jgi:trehalose 6-phosphate synthase/phosphatase